ncbi:MAG: hypothetical protein PHQ80_01240 [Candidatus ainarchaeum sp.]|nr:hypothetical protein [Candidatus ainarchaeum sp.]MDD5095943.1 hypothetical protein [Candidatus ainarchaeum sp.]
MAIPVASKNGAGKCETGTRRSLALAIAGSIMLAAPEAGARVPPRELPLPPRTAAQAPSEGRPPTEEILIEGFTIEMGCITEGMAETFRNAQVAVRESDCGMELTYALPGGGEKKVHFDSIARERRGAVKDVMVGEQHSVVLTENYMMVVPGRNSEWETVSSMDILLPDALNEHAFDNERNLFYFLTPEKRIYVIDVSDPDGDWERSLPNTRIGEDAKLAAFRGLLLVLQSGALPVLAFQGAMPGSDGWVEADYPLNPALEGPVSVESHAGSIVLRGGNATLTITIGTEGDASTLSVAVETRAQAQ